MKKQTYERTKYSKKTPTQPDGVALQFKITLNDSSPRVWRRIQVPVAYSFFDLHIAIQDAVGWTDSHLHAFRIAQKGTKRPLMIEYPHLEVDSDEDALDESATKVADYLGPIKQCIYDYDFGDSWTHTVAFEGVKSVPPGLKLPQCIAGAHACPPEDCGGVWGYAHLQEILKSPEHPEHESMLDWMGLDEAEDFDPGEFDPHEIVFEDPRERLKEYQRRG